MSATSNPESWQAFHDVLGVEYERLLTWFELRDPVVAETLRSVAYLLDTEEVHLESGRWRSRTDSDKRIESRLSDPQQLSVFRSELEATLQQSPQLVLLFGIETVDEIEAVLNAAVLAPEVVFLFLEPNPLRLSIRLSLLARTELLESSGAIWAVGEPFEEALVKTFHRHALYSIADDQIRVVFGCSTADDSVRTAIVPIIQYVVERITPRRETLQKNLVRFRDSIQKKSTHPSRVWSSGAPSHYTSTPILRALHRGLQTAGWECVLTETFGSRSDRAIENAGLIHSCPDTLLFLNGPTRLHVPQGEFHRLVWITDDPVWRPHHDRAPLFDPDEFVFYADRTFEPELIRQCAQRRMILPAFAVVNRVGTVRPEWSFPLVYAGMIHDLDPLLSEATSTVREWVEDAVHRVSEEGLHAGTVSLESDERLHDPQVNQLTARLCAKSGRTFSDELSRFRFAVYTVAISRRRWAVARALLPLGLHVFGGRDWLPLLGDAYADRYHGYIRYESLPDLYHSATLVLNIHSLQCPTCLNVRDFDVLYSGGCLLTDPVEAMGQESLLPGRDCAVAREPEAFAETASELLADLAQREALSRAGHTTVLENHLSHYRADTIMQAFSHR